MNICIVGGGHIGTTLTCYIKKHNQADKVSLFTRRPEKFSKVLKCNDWEGNFSFEVEPDNISGDPSVAAKDADIVFIALPHFAVEKAFKDIAPYVSDSALIGVLPGGGGCEFFFGKYFTNSQTLFGFQRVPFTAKLEKYGQEANLKSWKPFSVVGTQRPERLDWACEQIEACGLKTKKAANYLSVALTPTNPILHTSRTYEIFGKYTKDHVFSDKCKFYVGWTDEASHTLLTMDSELHQILDKIDELDTSAIRPLTEHYESPTEEAMTAKINSIATFQSVYAPMIEVPGGFSSDTTSRMFTEDFPWGLAIIRSYADIIGTKAPMMDKLLSWYAEYMGLEWYVDGKFIGKDLKSTGIPQIYGVNNRKKLLSYYL
ncbi:NAD/NADP octopine/nopaline dehydrogenase family protein [Butyrivibrio sp. INlla14]|uniref:NAD/NADP octopine/nopaline dehydrogenase family protein n=1 Tax=Butyrivibrio sp. INlla14 TaxID=1520808 RepID=UPI000876A858|nr:NAD/NADP octopine/nopaline dehydrogenase family protein [Butyrivibrio sp. INlla14]SCY65000.1 Ketopantoate reductase PanE/ApbA [Butyrivibrio sp. INlla14]